MLTQGITVRDKEKIVNKLDECYNNALKDTDIILPENITADLDLIFENIDLASSGFSNIITCLVCSAIDPDVDPRYHRKPKNDMPSPPEGDKWFSGRTISEKVLFTWLRKPNRNFRGAKSGWQTRTYERPYPYTLKYHENIQYIKEPFLNLLDYSNQHREQSSKLIEYLFKKEIQYVKERGVIAIKTAENIKNKDILISNVINALNKHFKQPQSSHLPSIAIYSLYKVMMKDFNFYNEKKLKDMDHHNSADKQTGAIGDIEIENNNKIVVEAIEIKHNIKINNKIIIDAKEKILDSNVNRYLILTTNNEVVEKNDFHEIQGEINTIFQEHGCQIIIDGILPTISHSLRHTASIIDFINEYSEQLSKFQIVTVEQLLAWNAIRDKL